MAGSVLGSAIGGVASGVFGSKGASDQAAATREAAQMADPFRSQRGMYQNILSSLYGGMAGASPPAPVTGGGGRGVGDFSSYAMAKDKAFALGDDSFPSYTNWSGGRGIFSAKSRGTQPGIMAATTGTGVGVGAATGGTGNSIMDFIRSSPDYQFRLSEGQRAIERSAAARGGRMSGGLLRDLTTFGQGQAASAFEAEINRIMTMAGATVGSPGVAGQIASQAASIQNRGQQQLMGGIGYGIGQLAQNWGSPSQSSMIQGQTGYTGGASGVLSGDEWASWG